MSFAYRAVYLDKNGQKIGKPYLFLCKQKDAQSAEVQGRAKSGLAYENTAHTQMLAASVAVYNTDYGNADSSQLSLFGDSFKKEA